MNASGKWQGYAPSLLLALLLVPAAHAAGTTPWGTPTLTDWNSVWSRYSGPLASGEKVPRGAPMPVPSAEYAPFLAAAVKARAEHKEISHTVRCLPPGVPGLNTFTYPVEFIIRPRQLNFQYEYSGYRRIRMNSQHPDYVEPSFVGDSVAHWEADTLVIDTVGITTKTVLEGGVRHSNRLHVIERMREVQPGIMQIHMWMEDPRAFVKPVEWSVYLKRTPEEDVQDHGCEHSREVDLGVTFDAFDVIPEPPQDDVTWARK